MAITFTWIVLTSVILLILMQAIFVFKYFHFMNAKLRPTRLVGDSSATDMQPPRVGIVLCLRGDDPSLHACLNSLFAQTYSNFEIHFVLDDRRDPALATLERFLATSDSSIQTTTQFLMHEIAQTCSLKNQALVSAISNADEAIEIFALVDADGVVEPDWLADLIQPLSDPKVGATTGGRWFAPVERNLGSLVRQTWNAAALPQMGIYNIPWGGSLAIKRSTILDCDLLDRWTKAFCEDTLLTKALAEQKLAVVRVPSVIVENKESTSLSSAIHWISRQLLTVRLHHSSWPLVLGHALFSPICFIGIVIAAILCVSEQKHFELTAIGLVVFAFVASNLVLMQVIQLANALHLRKDDPATDLFGGAKGPGLIAILVTQVVYPYAALKTALMRKVTWRGIEYAIGPERSISMKEYRAFRDCSDTATANENSIG